LNWTSGNVSVATVDSSGLVTAIAPGNVIITATTTDGSNISASCTVTVQSAPALIGGGSQTSNYVVDPSSASIDVGDTVPLTLNDISSTAPIQGVTWYSDNSKVATVNSNTGVVTGVSTGTTTIHVMIGQDIQSCTCIVTVNLTAPGFETGSGNGGGGGNGIDGGNGAGGGNGNSSANGPSYPAVPAPGGGQNGGTTVAPGAGSLSGQPQASKPQNQAGKEAGAGSTTGKAGSGGSGGEIAYELSPNGESSPLERGLGDAAAVILLALFAAGVARRYIYIRRR
jgi:plastocyanin